ncbi:type IV pilus modification PilV family protein [Engelhardtia mirabilis]|uniref:Type II secretion system protein n=1 Tax=Engelhardtia mirabilis TaxID=2528011 RepID=A0A518BQ19_9BACT|nr:hypothetical protein Pla133_41850 [Planctomycetes bacterium Pla133]QDV03396.1 hypothetical protein Pla86_41840 [Planctomycetes bacterium Pla86]
MKTTRKGGFTILEVVFAMGILLIGMSVVLGLLSFGAGLGSNAMRRAEAAGSLEFIVADLEERLFPILEDGSVGPPITIENAPVPGSDRLVYSASAVPEPNHEGPAAILYRVDIDVAWSRGGSERVLSFATLMPRQVPFGERLRQALLGSSGPPAVPQGGQGP